MSDAVARLRVFAGPNGSGKSTIKDALRPEWLGVYVNADEIEKSIRQHSRIDLAAFDLNAGDLTAIHDFMAASSLLNQHPQMLQEAARLRTEGSAVVFDTVEVNSYHASVLSDFIRHRLLAAGRSFTFETVMSSRDKILERYKRSIDLLPDAIDQSSRAYVFDNSVPTTC